MNESYCRILKADRSRLVGAHFSEFIPPERLKEAEEAFSALRKGSSTPVDFPLRAVDGSIVELDWTSSSSYLPGLYFCACRDITDRKRSELALRRSEHELRVVLNTAPAFIAYVGTDYRYLRVNRAYEDWFQLPAAEIVGKHIEDAFGTEHFRALGPRLQSALAGDVVAFESPVVRPNGERRQMSVTYTPDRNSSGVMHGFIALLQDITEKKRGEAELRAREEESRRLLAALPDIISRFDRSLRVLYTSPAVERFSGSPPEYFIGKTHVEAGLPKPLAKQLDQALERIFESSRPETIEFELTSPRLGPRNFVGTGMPETLVDGAVTTVLTIIHDVTEQKAAERERNVLWAKEQEAREAAELLNRVGPMLVGELDLQKLVQSATDIATKLIGAEIGSFFHNVIKESGEEYMLYTLSGVPREAFAGFPMPRNTAVFAPAFRGEGVMRSDDITKDPRYGKNVPFHGMPAGHVPVKSFLAAPVVSRSGEVLGSLFFGHSARGKFTKRHESIIAGIAAQAAIAMDNARLFEQSQWVQQELKQSNEKLRRANQDLKTFAYSASHDLQEPLRNIAISAQLLKRAAGPFQGDAAEFLNGVLQGTLRMRTLVEDLLAYTRAFKYAEGPLPPVAVSVIVTEVIESMRSQIDQSGASILVGDLPAVPMLEAHLAQLFQNLIANALKYHGREAPHILISATEQDGWWVFSVTDNGIGIDPRYWNQIFELFKRLHTRDQYPGTGIGLAICQRIVEQYGGRIWLERSSPGEGSTFRFSVPDRRPGSKNRFLAISCRWIRMSPWQKLLESPTPREHLVQLYAADEAALTRNVGQYLWEGLKCGEGLLVIATDEHSASFRSELNRLGADLEAAEGEGRLAFFDAGLTLSQFMDGGQPDWHLFERAVGAAMRQVRPSDGRTGLRAYGEMVGILWNARQFSAAIRLEQFWNKLLGRSSFSLYCAYAIDVFGKDFHVAALDELLCAHTHLVPAENSGHLEAAINLAMEEILGPQAHSLKLLIKPNYRPAWAVLPSGESIVLWLRNNLPDLADKILERAREHYVAAYPCAIAIS